MESEQLQTATEAAADSDAHHDQTTAPVLHVVAEEPLVPAVRWSTHTRLRVPCSFEDAAIEKQFVAERLPRAQKAVRIASVMWIVAVCVLTWAQPPDPTVNLAQKVAIGVRCVAIVFGLFSLAFCRFMGEKSIICVFVFALTNVLLINRYRTAWLVGEDPIFAWGSSDGVVHNDSMTLIALGTVVSSFSMFVPVRCFCGWVVAAAAPLLYAAMTLPLPELGPEENIKWRVALVLAFGINGFLLFVGQVRNEISERDKFLVAKTAEANVVKERVLRYRRSRASFGQYGHPKSRRTWESVTTTEKAFGTMEVTDIVSVGLKEHWIIRSNFNIDMDDELGRGGFGVVVRGTLCGLPVAVKLPKIREQPRGGGKGGLAAFLNELRILRGVRHSNIALFYGAYLLETSPISIAIVMEEVQGTDLEQYLAQWQKQLQQEPCVCVQLLVDICRALWYLHEHHPRIVHGDLKGRNVLVNESFSTGKYLPTARAKLIDFGLSRILSRHTEPTGGTFAWMAPELFLNPQLLPHPSLDVFAFGRLAFLVFSGRRPCNEKKIETLWQEARSGQLEALPWHELRIHAEGAEVFEHCLAFDASERPTMCKIHEKLRAWPGSTVLL